MSAHDALRRGIGTAFNVLSRQFMPNVTVSLLKPSETEDDFDTLLEISSKRFFEYSNYRKNFLLEIADDNETLTENIQAATHVMVDDDIYVILQGDTTPPKSTDVTWKIYCDKNETKGAYTAL